MLWWYKHIQYQEALSTYIRNSFPDVCVYIPTNFIYQPWIYNVESNTKDNVSTCTRIDNASYLEMHIQLSFSETEGKMETLSFFLP